MRRNAEKYKKPPIPEKYSYVLGEWNTGFVIQRNCDGSQFVWIPVGSLKANGTLKAMNEKAYKAMGLAGAAGIAVGIVVTVIGIAAGVISIISGARLLKEKKGILF